MCWTLLYTNKHKYVNKTRALLHTTGGKVRIELNFYVEIVTDITTRNSEREDT